MKRAPVPVEDDFDKASKLKAAEDLEDLKVFRERESEPAIDFETFVSQMEKDGVL